MKVLWRSDVLLNSIGTEVRLINMAGDVIFEFALPVRMTFRERVRNIVRYLFPSHDMQDHPLPDNLDKRTSINKGL